MSAVPTRPGWWAGWEGWAGGRRRARLLPRDWPPLPLYTPDQLRHLIRLESALAQWPPTSPGWRAELDARWRLPDLLQNIRLEHGGSISAADLSRIRLDGGGAGGGGGGGAVRGWGGAARGWAAGALLLAAVLLLVRALERCLHRRLFKGRRRTSEEWPRPNVLATSCRFPPAIPGLEDTGEFPSENRETVDLPPPYSECANNEAHNPGVNKPIGSEEPPPPYSACYFSNPKDGVPSVHLYSRRRDRDVEIGECSTAVNEADKISNSEVSEVNEASGGSSERDGTVRVGASTSEMVGEVSVRNRNDEITVC